MRTTGCVAPSDPGWPVGLFAFHGIFEYGYLDSSIGTVNSSVVDPNSLYNIQDFRIAQFTDSGGTTQQFRGASGWYFQAAASTVQSTRINNTVNDERNITNRSSWGDVVGSWSGGTNIKPITNLFMGLTTFGGYTYGTRDPSIMPGSPYYPRYLTDPGPIRMTYLYGDTNSYNNCRMQFQLQSACKARLKGTTQAIPNWASSGSLVPDSSAADISLIPGSDNFIIFDGLRAIRIRVLGWLAHMADHAVKQTDSFDAGTFPGGMTMVWKENSTAFAFDGSTPLGDFTPQYTTSGGVTTYGNKLEWTGFHHYNFGNWADSTLGAPDRYHLKCRAKVWYKVSGAMPAQPDPYKVLLGSTYNPADEVVEVQATVRQTVHQGPSGPPFNTPANYANNAGFVLTLSQTVDKVAYIHLTFHYNDQIIGTQFWGGNSSGGMGFPVAETYNNTILFQKINSTDQITDDYSASLVAQPFGTYANSPLPPVYLAVTNVTGTRFRRVYYKVCWTIPKPSSGVTYDVAWGDGTTTTGLTSDTFDNAYDNTVGTIYRAVLTVHTSATTYTHGTTVKV